jgi:hypothetical protein
MDTSPDYPRRRYEHAAKTSIFHMLNNTDRAFKLCQRNRSGGNDSLWQAAQTGLPGWR